MKAGVWSVPACVALVLAMGCANQPRTSLNGFTAISSGDPAGAPGKWEVQSDAGRPIIVQTSTDSTNGRFPVLIRPQMAARDVEVSVRIKPIGGKGDQAGGIVLRFKDKDNYYIVRSNALENNVRLYKVVAGKRIQFAGKDIAVPSGQWHDLKIEARGSDFEVSFNGKKLFDAKDSTFNDAGNVGLWTKADSVTAFDNLKINSLD